MNYQALKVLLFSRKIADSNKRAYQEMIHQVDRLIICLSTKKVNKGTTLACKTIKIFWILKKRLKMKNSRCRCCKEISMMKANRYSLF